MTRFAVAASLFVAANILHTLDHLRQGLDRLTPEILTAGTLLLDALSWAVMLAEIAAGLVLAVAGAREVTRHSTA
jgi:hypothetical protein